MPPLSFRDTPEELTAEGVDKRAPLAMDHLDNEGCAPDTQTHVGGEKESTAVEGDTVGIHSRLHTGLDLMAVAHDERSHGESMGSNG